ncbi:CgeB family protein [Paenibacillus piri]|uniref:Spore maturation protein cgeB n=1 Tax=Paenibacillus piri TaxID=2547395 RepID=A0A4R5KK24_9BACL|nr:glycosyltransferase [Paenibacillus piri]TDF95188.1 spore maturation protein cgeB [Paenibacillus piri]
MAGLVKECVTADVRDDVARLVSELHPDLVLVILGDMFPVAQVEAIRKMGVKTAVWFTDDPYYTDVTANYAAYYDFVFTQEISCVPLYQSLGCSHVHYLPLAVHTAIFHRNEEVSKDTDICFLGTAWINRIALFDQIASELNRYQTLVVGPDWGKLGHKLLPDKIQPVFLSPEQSAYCLNASKIAINNHRAYDDTTFFDKNSRRLPAHSINPRTFEIAACGTFQLTDVREELVHNYTVGKEIETYSSPEELIEKIRYYLTHEEERNTIALRGLHRTLQEQTYPHRLKQLLNVVFEVES